VKGRKISSSKSLMVLDLLLIRWQRGTSFLSHSCCGNAKPKKMQITFHTQVKSVLGPNKFHGKAVYYDSTVLVIFQCINWDWQFSHLSAFHPMVFHFAQTKQKWKNYRDQGRLTFLAPLHQTPSHRITLLFATHACDSNVSLLTG